MRQNAVARCEFVYPWLFECKLDLLLFFLPILFAVPLTIAAGGSVIAKAPVLLAVLLDGFGIGAFHLGATWYHYFDERNRKHYTSRSNLWWSAILPVVLIISTIGGSIFAPDLVYFVYLVWTIQHLTQQNVGILRLYHNQPSIEAVVERSLEASTVQAAAVMFGFMFLARIVMPHTWQATVVQITAALCAIEFSSVMVRYIRQLFSQLRSGKALNVPAQAFWIISLVFLAPLGCFAQSISQGIILALFMHWIQYIGLNAILVQKKYAQPGEKRFVLTGRPLVLFCTIGFLFALIKVPAETLTALNVGQMTWQYQIVNGLFLGLAFTHYLQDTFIWRFKDEFNKQAILQFLKPTKTESTIIGANPRLAARIQF